MRKSGNRDFDRSVFRQEQPFGDMCRVDPVEQTIGHSLMNIPSISDIYGRDIREMTEEDQLFQLIRGKVDKYYALSGGNIETIGLLLSEIAGILVPPKDLIVLLSISEEQLSRAQKARQAPVATLDQFAFAILKAIEPGDTQQQYERVLDSHIKRLENSKKIMSELKDSLASFHAIVNGKLSRIESFFCDLAPPPHTGNPMPPGMINQLLRVDKSADACTADQFLQCFERNLDATDSASAFVEIIAKHSKA